MSSPDSGDVHVNSLLTNMSIAYTNELGDYIADKAFPAVFVDKQTDIYLKYTKDYWYRSEAKKRAPGAGVAKGDYTIDTSNTYRCENVAVGRDIFDEIAANADAPINLEEEAVQWVTQQLFLEREIAFATDFVKGSVWTDGSVTAKFDLYGTSDPLKDFDTAARTIRQKIGRAPNLIIMGELVFDRLKRHPDFLDAIKYTQRAIVDTTVMASIINHGNILVGKAMYTTGDEGEASYTYTPIIDDDVLMLYQPPSVGLYTPCAGKTFVWRPLTGGSTQFIRRYREDKYKKLVIEGMSYYDHVATSTDSGYTFIDCCD